MVKTKRVAKAIVGLSFVAMVVVLSQLVIPAFVPSFGWALALLTAAVVVLVVLVGRVNRRIERSDRLT